MASNLSCSLLVLGKSSDGVMSSWMRCRKTYLKTFKKAYLFVCINYLDVEQDHLSECPLCRADLVNHPKGNAHHGGESEQPADDIPPPWVHILIVVL